MPGYSGAGAGFKKPFTPDQIPGLKQAAGEASGRAYPEIIATSVDMYGNELETGPSGRYYVNVRTGEGDYDYKRVIVDPQDIVYKNEEVYDPWGGGVDYEGSGIGAYRTQKVGYSTGQSIIDKAMADPLSWVASNVNFSGLGHGGDFTALDEQMKFLKDNKYDLSSLPNQGAVNQYNLTKQILDQGTTSKWSGQGYGTTDINAPIENAKVMAGMLANTGITDIKDFGKFNGVVSRQLTNVQLKDPVDPSKGYVYPEVANDEFTGKMLDVPKDVQVRDVQVGYTPEDSYILKQADIPIYGETFGNKVTKQSFVDAQNYNMAQGNIFSGTYIGHGRTNYGVQFAADGTPYFYTQFGGDTSSMADIAPIISFLAAIPTPLQPFAAAANALISIDNGNILGGLASLAGIPGVSEAAGAAGLANVATAIKTANQVVNLVNAIETGNVMAIATSAAGMLGANTGSMQIGDTGLTVSDAMKAVNLVKAIGSEDPTAIFKAAVGFGTAPNIQKALNSPTTTLDADGQRVADVVDTNFVADLVDPNSENFLGGAEESLGTTLAAAPDNVKSFDTVLSGLKDFGSKYFGGAQVDSTTLEMPDNVLASATYTPENIGNVGNLLSGSSADVAGGSNLVDLAAIERARGQVTLGDIQGNVIDLTNVAPGGTLPEVIVGGTSKEDVDNILRAEDEEVQAELQDAINKSTLVGGAAEDTLKSVVGEDALKATEGADTIEADGEDTIASTTGTDSVSSAAGDDTVNADASTDTAGNITDQIKSQEEILTTAKETLSEAKKEASDNLDLAYLAGIVGDPVGQAVAEYKAEKAQEVVAEQKEIIASTVTVIEELKKEEVNNLLNDTLIGGLGNDALLDEIGASTLVGGLGDDTLIVADGADTTNGGLVDDALIGDLVDTLVGATGADTLSGGTGADTSIGGTGEDTTAGGVVLDTTDDGAGDDTLDSGAATLVGGAADDALSADTGQTTLVSADGDDSLVGGEGDDTVSGEAGETILDGGVSTDTSGADSLAGAADDDALIDGADTANNGVTSEDDWLGGTGGDSLDGGVSTDTSGSNDALLDLSSEEVGQGEVDAINDDALLDLSSAEVGEGEQKAINESESTNDDGTCKLGFHDDGTGLCVSDEDEPETQECKIGEVRNLTTGLCEPAVTTGGGGGGGGSTLVRRTATTIPFLFPSTERPIVTAPSINDDPVMRGALPDMPAETKFQGPLDQFLKLATESSTPKPQQPQQQQAGNMNDRLTYPQGGSDYFSYGQQSDIDNNLYPQFGQAPTDQPMDGALQFNQGGLAVPLMAAGGTRYGQYAGGGLNVVQHSGKHRVDFRKGDAVTGPGDGQSDDIPAMLADGEFVFPADVVAALGNGSTKAGSDKLYDMMHSIRAYHRSAKPKDLPPPAKKSPLDYLKGKKSTKARS